MNGTAKAEAVAAQLAEEGVRISPRTIRGLWAAVKAVPLPPADQPPPSTPPPSEPEDGLGVDGIPMLWRTARAEDALARTARTQGKYDQAKKHTETFIRCVSLIDKLTPVRPPDPNDNQWVRLSADRCIAKLHEMLERKLAAK